MSAAVENVSLDSKGETSESSSDSALVAVSPEPVMKHPLKKKWTIWYYLNDKRLKWEDNQVEVASFDTVEDFWSLFNHIETASRIKVGSDYSVFRHGIRPMWEDKANVNGGRWSLTLNKSQRSNTLDIFWMELLLMMISETSKEDVNREICGAVISLRPRGDRISLWTADAKNSAAVMEVGKSIKTVFGLGMKQIIEYNLHSDTSNKKSSSVRALFTM